MSSDEKEVTLKNKCQQNDCVIETFNQEYLTTIAQFKKSKLYFDVANIIVNYLGLVYKTNDQEYLTTIAHFEKSGLYLDVANIIVNYLGLVYKTIDPIMSDELKLKDKQYLIPLDQQGKNFLPVFNLTQDEPAAHTSFRVYSMNPYLAEFEAEVFSDANDELTSHVKHGFVINDKIICLESMNAFHIHRYWMGDIVGIGFIKFENVEELLKSNEYSVRIIGITTDGSFIYVIMLNTILSKDQYQPKGIYGKLQTLLFELQDKWIVDTSCF